MAFTVKRATDWPPDDDRVLLRRFLCCTNIRPIPKLIWCLLVSLGDSRLESVTDIDVALQIHRHTRTNAIAELCELGFLRGMTAGVVVQNPLTANPRLQYHSVVFEDGPEAGDGTEIPVTSRAEQLAAAWNAHRPANYKRIAQPHAGLIKAVNAHMRDLGLTPYDYEAFFSVLAAGVRRSRFWSQENTSKTLASITGLNRPTEKKAANVLRLYSDGLEAPREERVAPERADTLVLPAALRPLISEYHAAQHAFAMAYDMRRADPAHATRVLRAESAIRDAGFDPQLFRLLLPQVPDAVWPTPIKSPAPGQTREYTFDDELNKRVIYA
jgi:hypothetical protein